MRVKRISLTAGLNKTLLAVTLSSIIHSSVYAASDDAEKIVFDNGFLMGSQSAGLDLSRYAEGNPAQAGTFQVKVWVNDEPMGQMDITFIDIDGKSAQPCLTTKNMAQFYIRLPGNALDEDFILKKQSDAEENCLDLAAMIPEARIHFDSGDRQLKITVPQAWQLKKYRNYVDPSLWENGINAAMLSYNANAWRSEYDQQNSTSYYASLVMGANLGAWRLRSNGSWSATDSDAGKFEFQNRYLQRDFPSLRSQLVLGETWTTGETFDSINIKGARFYSDSRMLPPTLSNYAPVVRGVAYSNAKVTISQGGYTIYETTVPPGPFALDDFSPSGYGNDIYVTIEEADGSKKSFSIPYNSVAQMMRPGVARWDLAAGRVSNDDLHEEPNVVQGTVYYGLNNYFTGYTGIQATDNHYLAGMLGLGINTPVGAFSVDVTHSRTDIPNDSTYSGQSYRLSWSTMVPETSTSISLAAYRYSTRDYLGLNDAVRLIDNANHPDTDDEQNISNYQRLRNRFNINISQPLGSDDNAWGSLYANASWSDYWGEDGTSHDYSLGYNNTWNEVSYSVNMMRSYGMWGESNDSISLSVSIPFSIFSHNQETVRSGFRSVEVTAGSDLNGTHQMMLSSSGNTENGEWSYGLNTSYNVAKEGEDISTTGGFLSWESPIGTLAGSATASSNHSRQYSLSTDGGFVLHSGGLTFSNNSFNDADTLAVIKAPGAKGARISSGSNQIDRWGYGVASSLSPYRENSVSINTFSMENDIELKNTSGMVIPRQGSVMLLNFETDEGRSAVINIARSDNQPLPFSAEVYDEKQTHIGNVGQGGQAFVRGIKEAGTLTIRWGDAANERCVANYQVPADPLKVNKSIILSHVVCQMAGGA